MTKLSRTRCEHCTRKARCAICNGCSHGKRKDCCAICMPETVMANNCRRRIRSLLSIGFTKEYRTTRYLGCNAITLKIHLESQFTEYMSWDNYGYYWHIDHKIPIMYSEDGSIPDLETIKQRLHYSNLQPLRADLNCSKQNRYKSL